MKLYTRTIFVPCDDFAITMQTTDALILCFLVGISKYTVIFQTDEIL